MIYQPTAIAQCANNQPAPSISYDTSFTGSGNNEDTLTFPRFDLSLGTLISVRIETIVTLIYSFQLENNNATTANQRVRITRTDEISYPWSMVTRTDNKNLGPYSLGATDGIPGSGPDYIEDGPLPVFQNLLNTYIITDVAPFLGTDSIDLYYATTSFANAVGNLNSTLRGQAEDLTNFKVIYFYCPTVFLATDIMQFSAMKISRGDIQLKWLTPNDYVGKRYEVEKSADGRYFRSFRSFVSGSTPLLGNQVIYHPGTEDKNKIYFRVRQIEADGSSKYSAIRYVVLDPLPSAMRLFPTLISNSFNIQLPTNGKADYKVTILSTSGQVVQVAEFSKTNFLRVDIDKKLTTGMYFVTVLNKQTMVSQQSKIMVR